MASATLLLVLVAASCALAHVVPKSKDAVELTKQSESLPKSFQDEWKKLLDKLDPNLDEHVQQALRSSPTDASDAMQKAITELKGVIGEERKVFKTFLDDEHSQVSALLKKVNSFVLARLQTKGKAAIDVTQVIKLKQEKNQLTDKLDDRIVKIALKTRERFMHVFESAVRKTSSPIVKKVLRETFENVTSTVVDYQAAVFTTMRSSQYAAIDRFYTEAARILSRHAVSEVAPHVGE